MFFYFCINAAIRQKNVSSTECGRDRLLNNDAMREVDEIRVPNNDFIKYFFFFENEIKNLAIFMNIDKFKIKNFSKIKLNSSKQLCPITLE